MLLSSILEILNRHKTQVQVVEKMELCANPAAIANAKEVSALEKIELEIAAASGLLKPFGPEPKPSTANLGGASLDELLRTIADLRKPDPSRVVDVFE